MGPAFLVIGFTRCGTTFLHTHLRRHPQVWLPPQKELHYLSFQRQGGWGNSKHRKHLRRAGRNLRHALKGKRGPREELLWQARYLLGRRSDRWFLSLYDEPGGRFVTGQVEPTYARTPDDVIEAFSRIAPDVKLLFMMRDPVERAWSSVTKSTAKNKGRAMANVPEADIFEKLDRSALSMSSYIEHIERWERHFPADRFFYGFFDEIQKDPGAFMDRVCSFVGVSPLGDRSGLGDAVNTTHVFKVEIPPEIECRIGRELLKPTRRLAGRFGGVTTSWLERVERAAAAR